MIISLNRGTRACLLLLACLSLLAAGCAYREGVSDQKTALEGVGGSIVIIGFQPVLLPGRQSGMVRNPLTGAFRYAEPVPQEVADKRTYSLFEHLTRSSRHHFVSPRDAKSWISTIDSPFRIGGDLKTYIRVGESLSADAFLAGYIWRWKERKGSELAVESPASVDFDLYLIRLVDKAIVWQYEYDKTQQSLSENVLDFKTFLKAGGRWLSAAELAELGLEEMVEAFPKKSE
jgi:hypothetical protein